MAEDPDFAALYRELGVMPDCTLDEFRQAYRRSVSRLHPDQHGDAQDIARLQALNQRYASAIEFHRAYGRLPGALLAAAPTAQASSHATHASPAMHAAATEPTQRQSGSERHSRWFIAVALVAIAVLAIGALAPRGASEAPPPAHHAPDDASKAATEATIALGMGMEEVTILQGAPIASQGTRWEYGPSWIDFRCGKVAGWYSSSLHPLRVRSAHPPPQDKRDSKAGDC